jgi:hypothetical protein
MARTIQSPGVEIREVDLSLRGVTSQGTSILITGFSNQGPIDEIIQPTSLSEFEQIYGAPTNAAERYFYHTVKAAFQSPSQLLVSRLPYGVALGEGFDQWKYSALVYPVVSYNNASDTAAVSAGKQVVTLTNTIGNYSVYGVSLAKTLSGSGFRIGLASGTVYDFGYAIDGNTPVFHGLTSALSATIVIDSSMTPQQLLTRTLSAIDNTITGGLTSTGTYNSTTSTFNVQITNTVGGAVATAPATYAAYTNVGSTQFAISYIPGTNAIAAVSGGVVSSLSAATTYFFGTPTHIELSVEQYQELLNNNVNWSDTPSVTSKNTPYTYNTLGESGFIVLNKSQTTINSKFEGYYIGITDNNNNNPATPFDGILNVNTLASNADSNSYIEIPRARLNFSLSASKFGDGSSISEVQENMSKFDISPRAFDDTVLFGLYKLRQSVFSPDVIALDYIASETYTGSLDFHRQIADQNGGPAISFYLGQQQASSPNINTIVNPFLNDRYGNTWLNDDGTPSKKVRFLSDRLATPFNVQGFTDTSASYSTRVGAPSAVVNTLLTQLGPTNALFPIGVYNDTVATNKDIGNLPDKLERVFELVENPDLYPISVACEAGLGTIYVNAVERTLAGGLPLSGTGPFIDSEPLNALSAWYTTNSEELSDEGLRLRANYNAVASVFVNQAQNQRKDFMVILDPIRNIFVQGDNAKVINSKKLYGPNAGEAPNPNAPGFVSTNFSQHIYWPLRHQFGITDTSYAAIYANVAQVLDNVTNRQVWVPFSGFAAAAMGNTDANFQPWFAPAGFTRGVLVGVNDLGIYPKQKQRDQLYKISLNPVTFFPVEGFVIYGQKTALKKPSAFDRINVRRLFLTLEVLTRNTVKYFVFEPNTLFTRTQVINTLTPIFENAKNTDGVYDYLIICDERNNTPDVIDNNELKVDLYLKPVRTAEFILVSFYATRTSQNFQELLA